MGGSALKDKLIQRIREASESKVAKVYEELLSILEKPETYVLSKEEENAINEAIYLQDTGEKYSTIEVKEEAKRKFPNLNFDEKD